MVGGRGKTRLLLEVGNRQPSRLMVPTGTSVCSQAPVHRSYFRLHYGDQVEVLALCSKKSGHLELIQTML